MMFISKFNLLIRNKIVWGIFAFIVVMAFVVWGTQTSGGRGSAEQKKVGMLDEKEVSSEEFNQAYFNSYLSMALMFGRPLNITEKMNQALRKMAWKRLAALRKAKTMNVPVTADEVIGAIHNQPYFQVQGLFSPERYQAFVNNFLLNLRTSEPQFEEYIRQEIILTKLRYLLAQAVWVSPLDVNHIFHQLYDEFVVSYVALLQEELEHMVTMTEAKARIFFEEHREWFTIPEKMGVEYVAFTIENYVDKDSIDDDVVRSYYDDHIEEFTAKGTDDWDTILTFEEVEDPLRELLAWEAATLSAGEKATEFEDMLVPERDGTASSFEEAASAMGLTISTSDSFSAQEVLEGLDVGLDFNKAAFDLQQTPEDYFSYPIQGEKAFYILAYRQRTDSYVPDFEEVKEDVMMAAREKAVLDKLEQLSSDIHNAVADALANGSTFCEATAPSGLEVTTTEPFSVTSGLNEYTDSEEFYMVIRHAISCNAKELTDIIPIEDGFLIAYVESRTPAQRSIYESMKSDLVLYIKQKRDAVLFSDWQAYLLKSANFEDLMPEPETRPDESDL